MTCKTPEVRFGMFLLALLGTSAVHTASALAQTPTYLTQWGALGTGNGQFDGPDDVATDASDNVYVADTFNYRIQKFGTLPTPAKPTTWGRLKARYR